MYLIRSETPRDFTGVEMLLDLCFGPSRFAKTCQRLRDGRVPANGLAFLVRQSGQTIATVRLWTVLLGSAGEGLMLGPLAVHPDYRELGLGARLMRHALNQAGAHGQKAVILVGDPEYYARFGFSRALTRGLALPGPVEDRRFLGVELQPGALDGATGMVRAPEAVESDLLCAADSRAFGSAPHFAWAPPLAASAA